MTPRTSEGTDRAHWLAGLVVVVVGLAGGPAVAQEVTFTQDVAPIMWEHCVECHRPGSFAPMSLLSYETAHRYASLIKFRVQERLMPPWHIDKSVGVQGLQERRLAERRPDRDDRPVGRRGRAARQR